MDSTSGTVLSHHNLSYAVPVKNPDKKCGTILKHILKNINGIYKSGMNAVLGPRESGKTTLLDILAGRKDRNDVTGTLLVNGHAQPKSVTSTTGYVVAEDTVMGTLTVKENFMFSANLRLPKTTTQQEKEEKVNDVVNQLGLDKCADTKIGNEFLRGVSGGERKRTNIGMELITNPSVLILDEATTGLDASTAHAVMDLLYQLSRQGRTVIFAVQQPRYAIFDLFDKLTLLSQGHTVYHGPANEASEYFQSIGYFCQAYNNPADYFLDILNGDASTIEDVLNTPDYEDLEEEAIEDLETKQQDLSVDLAEKYKACEQYSRLLEELDPIVDRYNQETTSKQVSTEEEYATPVSTQLYILSKRAVLNNSRNPQAIISQIGVMVAFGIILGIIYFQVDASIETGIQNRIGAFFILVMNMIFGNLSSVDLFIKERRIFMHENSGGFYRVTAYFISKLFCDVIPMRAIPVLLFSPITYFMIGFQIDVGKFFFYTLNLFITSMFASAIGFLVSSSVSVVGIANIVMALIFVFMMLFGGFLISIEDIAVWIRWLQYFSIFRYSMNALTINEMKDMWFYGTRLNETGEEEIYWEMAGNNYMDTQGINYETDWDLWLNEVAMASMAIILLAFTFIRLWTMKKTR